MKSRVAPLSNWSTANGPYEDGSANPSTPPSSRAAAQMSFACTRVWLNSTLTLGPPRLVRISTLAPTVLQRRSPYQTTNRRPRAHSFANEERGAPQHESSADRD